MAETPKDPPKDQKPTPEPPPQAVPPPPAPEAPSAPAPPKEESKTETPKPPIPKVPAAGAAGATNSMGIDLATLCVVKLDTDPLQKVIQKLLDQIAAQEKRITTLEGKGGGPPASGAASKFAGLKGKLGIGGGAPAKPGGPPAKVYKSVPDYLEFKNLEKIVLTSKSNIEKVTKKVVDRGEKLMEIEAAIENNKINLQLMKRSLDINTKKVKKLIEKKEEEEDAGSGRIAPANIELLSKMELQQTELETKVTEINTHVKKVQLDVFKLIKENDPKKADLSESEIMRNEEEEWKAKTDLIVDEVISKCASLKQFEILNNKFKELNTLTTEHTSVQKLLGNKLNYLEEKTDDLQNAMNRGKLDDTLFDDVQESPENKAQEVEKAEDKKDKDDSRIKAKKPQRVVMTNARDKNKLQQLEYRVSELEEKVANLIRNNEEVDMKGIVEEFKEIKERFEKKANALDLKKINGRIDDQHETFRQFNIRLENIESNTKLTGTNTEDDEEYKALKLKVSSLDIKINSMNKSMKEMSKKMQESFNLNMIAPQANMIEEDPAKEEKITEMLKDFDIKISEIRKTMKEFKSDMNKFRDGLSGKVDSKATVDQVDDLENKIYRELDKILATLTKKFPDKADVKRMLQKLEVQFKKMQEYQMASSQMEMEDGMFIKRPLGGYSCAACEKDIINLQGSPGEYNAWQKFPYRDPNERLARVGHGFSKMLANLKPDHMGKSQSQAVLVGRRAGSGLDMPGEYPISPSTQNEFYPSNRGGEYIDRPGSDDGRKLPKIPTQRPAKH